MRSLALLLLVAACAAPDVRDTRDFTELQNDLATRTAGAAQSCISADSQTSLRIVDNQTLVYDQGRTLWVNRLTGPCPGLRPMDTLVVEMHGSQYCRGDHFQAVSAGGSIPGPACFLGDFTPYRRPG